MRIVPLALLVVAALAASASAAAPTTRLTIATTLEGGRSPHAYTLTCGPAGVRGLPVGRLDARDACRALAVVGDRLYRPRLSTHIKGCNYIVAPRRATIAGYRLGRRVSTVVELGGCERLLVSRATLARFVVWTALAARS